MTAQILSADLTSIISDTKRKAPDLRVAAERSLAELRALPSTSEAQLAADLRRRPQFIDPFLAACKRRQPKGTLPAVSCLQRLIVSTGLPPERLKDVLEAYQECVGSGEYILYMIASASAYLQGLDVQLKILQSLPSLLQGYGHVLEGEVCFLVVRVCAALQQVKHSAVSSTASATLQQIVSSIYEKVEAEDENADDIGPIEGVTVRDESVPVRPAAYDAYRILQDMCLIIEGQQPHYLVKTSISSAFGLELIEALLLNHAEVFETHAEQADLLLHRVMPLVNSCLAERHAFGVTVRAMRLLCILLREHLQTVHTECEVAFGLLNHIIETETQQSWRRALSMEAFRLLYSNADLFVDVYSRFDMQENRRNVIQDNQALFVRLASEKPALIGLGQQSTVPSTPSSSTSKDQAVLGAEAAAGMIGGDFGVSEKDVPGISNEWSTVKVPCLDQLDKSEGPVVPETYIYSLVLTCINQLSDALAKIILPVAMHQNKFRRGKSPTPKDEHVSTTESKLPTRQPSSRSARSRSIPTNPLDLKDHPAYASIKVVTSVVNSCWPAVLATSSTFFNAALDAEFYRSLVRSFQKFTQVAGILRLTTPRDALLTSLSKFAVPPSLLSSDSVVSSPNAGVASPGGSVRFQSFPVPGAEAFSLAGPDTPTRSRRSSIDLQGSTLTQRNLMCLRALVHLAIALGPILDKAWSIVLDSTQKAHVLLQASRTMATAQDYRAMQSQAENANSMPTLGSEISAVESAMTRLFISTSDYPSEAFQILLKALCDLIHFQSASEPRKPSATPSATLTTPAKAQRRVPSVSGLAMSAVAQPAYSHFAVSKLGETAKANLVRLTEAPSEGWDLIMTTLTDVTSSKDGDDATRRMAADVVARLTAEACISTTSAGEEVRKGIQQRSFAALRMLVDGLPQTNGRSSNTIDMEIQQTAFDALHSILEHCADSIIAGWDIIFAIASSAFPSPPEPSKISQVTPKPLSAKLARSSFASLQLICSDFIGSLPQSSLTNLVDIMALFGLQPLDINISLTVVAQLWNVSDYLQKQITHFDLTDVSRTTDIDSATSRQRSISRVWLNLQQHLADLTSDHRADVRNGSIHTIYRTLDSCGAQLSHQALEVYLRTVLFKMMGIDSKRQIKVGAQHPGHDAAKALVNSSKIVIEGCARFVAGNLGSIQELTSFAAVWQSLLEAVAAYIGSDSLLLIRSVFVALNQILEADSPTQLSPEAVNKVAALWARAAPLDPVFSEDGNTDEHEAALVAYIRCLHTTYKHLQGHLKDDQIEMMLSRLNECVEACTPAPYTNDMDRPTELQGEVLKSYGLVRQGAPANLPQVLKHLSKLCRLPYTSKLQSTDMQQLTFIALAKNTMGLMREIIAEDKSAESLHDTDALSAVFESLLDSMARKYTWRKQGKPSALWRKATSSSLAILANVLPKHQKALQISTNRTDFLRILVSIADHIQKAEYNEEPTDDSIIIDETFDLEAISTCRKLLTPLLDSIKGIDNVRMQYIDDLSKSSKLHLSPFDDVDEPLAALIARGPQQLKHVRPGRTYEPDFTTRVRMCYSCFDELFALATAASLTVDGTKGERVVRRQERLLAPIAHQALLLRCAVPLKRYIADQPLRGRMPTPMSQRLELLHILKRVRGLYAVPGEGDRLEDFDDVAPGWPGILEALAPLVNQARELAVYDRELAGAMGKVLEMALGR